MSQLRFKVTSIISSPIAILKSRGFYSQAKPFCKCPALTAHPPSKPAALSDAISNARYAIPDADDLEILDEHALLVQLAR